MKQEENEEGWEGDKESLKKEEERSEWEKVKTTGDNNW